MSTAMRASDRTSSNSNSRKWNRPGYEVNFCPAPILLTPTEAGPPPTWSAVSLSLFFYFLFPRINIRLMVLQTTHILNIDASCGPLGGEGGGVVLGLI